MMVVYSELSGMLFGQSLYYLFMIKAIQRISAMAHSYQKQLWGSKGAWGISQSLSFLFSKAKKGKPEVKGPSIHFSKCSEQHDGFLIYQNQEGIRIKAITLAFLFCFLSGFWTYTRIDDDQIKVNYMIMGGLMAIPFLVFQFRTAKTLKRLVLDRTGENVILSRFALGGFTEENTKARVEVLRGIGKAFAFGGSVIKGGGVYGLEQRNYWFQSKYIMEREVFEELVQGNRVKIDKSKLYE